MFLKSNTKIEYEKSFENRPSDDGVYYRCRRQAAAAQKFYHKDWCGRHLRDYKHMDKKYGPNRTPFTVQYNTLA